MQWKTDLDLYDGSYRKELDGIRGLAVLLVVFFHFFDFMPVTRIFWIGMDVFFVLSGFLITGILIRTPRHPKSYFKFLIRRTLRIFPLYYFTLIIFFLVIPHFLPEILSKDDLLYKYQGWYWLYGQNFLFQKLNGFLESDRDNILNHFWSLSVEEQFYLIWPLLVLALSRRKILAVSASLIITSVVIRAILVSDPQIHWFVPYSATYTRLDALLIGGFAALIVNSKSLITYFRTLLIPIQLTTIALIALFILSTRQLSSFHVLNNSFGLVYFLIAIFFATIVLQIFSRERTLLHKVLGSGVLVQSGKISYSLYVIHLPVYLILRRSYLDQFVDGSNQIIGNLLLSTISLIATVLLAYITFNLIEKPARSYKRYFAEHSK